MKLERTSYKNMNKIALQGKADLIGVVRLKAWDNIRSGDNKSVAFKKAWKHVKSNYSFTSRRSTLK